MAERSEDDYAGPSRPAVARRASRRDQPGHRLGIDWANNLTQWLANKPSDPTGQLMAEQHVYNFNVCGTVACFDSQVTPVANVVPVVWGEYGEDDCGSGTVAHFLPYADAHISAAEAWTWDTWGSCESLISNFNGTPAGAYGTYVRNYYLVH